MELTERVAYIKGLVDGLKLDENKDEVKVISAMIELLDDMAVAVSDLEDATDEVTELIDVLDEDLGAIEEIVYDTDDDCCCGHDHGDYDAYDDNASYEVVCPTCGETISLDEEILDEGEISCPNCGENLEFDFDSNQVDTEEAE